MNHPILQAIADRRSIRQYLPEQITDEQLAALLRAAEQAPSARNLQPWHFSVVQNAELLREISDEVNRRLDYEGDIFHGAPTAIFISCDEENRWARLDCGIAVQTIALAAHGIGLGSVILGFPDAAFAGEKKEMFSERLKFPAGYRFAICIAVGLPAATKEAHPIEPGRIDFVS